jgi:Fur family ferric uptake transcriptional regulator
MCHQCNYEEMLSGANIDPTPNRVRVLEVIGNNMSPLSANEIFRILERNSKINQVTVYRILDLMVERGIVERISTGGRAFYYGLAPNDHHKPHPHFYCKDCGQMDCLSPESIVVDAEPLWKTYPGRIEKVEVRIDGICKNCDKRPKK